jgi:nitrate/TMAO reductase-like tetraheme cytochrome c subunit
LALKNPKVFYNWISLTGFIITSNSLILILILFLFSIFSENGNTYLGLLIYLVLPTFLVLGLILVPVGVLLNIRKKQYVGKSTNPWPIFDLNQRKDWATLVKITLITVIFLVASVIGSYRAFQYTESVEFCGTLCHKEMEPEYVTYQHSAHAKVTCVECHVGQGADWYVKSKMSGLYQVYSVLFKKYPKPIATPIHSLRPVRETCERCHWPEKFYSRKYRSQRSYLSDSANTEWNVTLLMKVGPEFSPMGLSEGIHWHINNNFKIEYISSSSNREIIPWVKLTNLKTGQIKTFIDEDNPLKEKEKGNLEIRNMDCMDCHNRPSHLYKSAPDYIDIALISRMLSKNVPYIKKAAMEALKNPFPDSKTAMESIEAKIMGFYGTQHPDILKSNELAIRKAIKVIQQEYKLNAFPYMKADASQYPNHIGHLESEGCFRCHSGRHKTATGESISIDCDICHTIIAQGPTGSIANSAANSSLVFQHPTELKEKAKTAFCSDCHRSLYD